jgi:hypothetical protein
MPSRWTPVEDAILATLPVAEVQRLTGRTMSSIIARRVRLKRWGEVITEVRISLPAFWGQIGDSVAHASSRLLQCNAVAMQTQR